MECLRKQFRSCYQIRTTIDSLDKAKRLLHDSYYIIYQMQNGEHLNCKHKSNYFLDKSYKLDHSSHLQTMLRVCKQKKIFHNTTQREKKKTFFWPFPPLSGTNKTNIFILSEKRFIISY
ncbi:hypothetical protein ACKWTF_009126 [Chironomus riparius]